MIKGVRKKASPSVKLRKPKSKYKSTLEDKMALLLNGLRVDFKYECKNSVLPYQIPASFHKYYPDWVVGDMILETKGLWDQKDREKILHILEQHPNIDLRMVFENPNLPIYKGSKTTYGAWCDKHGIIWGTMSDVPKWLNKY